jgi:hypothetical protein
VKDLNGKMFFECSKDDVFGTLRTAGALGACIQLTW